MQQLHPSILREITARLPVADRARLSATSAGMHADVWNAELQSARHVSKAKDMAARKVAGMLLQVVMQAQDTGYDTTIWKQATVLGAKVRVSYSHRSKQILVDAVATVTFSAQLRVRGTGIVVEDVDDWGFGSRAPPKLALFRGILLRAMAMYNRQPVQFQVGRPLPRRHAK